MKEGICTAVGLIGSFIASLFGGWDTGLVTLIIFMAIDYISGLAVAGIFHNSKKTDSGTLESKAGWKGLCRKCMTLLFVLIAYRLDLAIGSSYIRDAVIIGFIANISIHVPRGDDVFYSFNAELDALFQSTSLEGTTNKKID
jgi:toxin secretion/phage lysis holin